MKITLSVIKADIGGYVGHSSMHPRLMEIAEEELKKAQDNGVIIDFHVLRVGDDLELIMTHNNSQIFTRNKNEKNYHYWIVDSNSLFSINGSKRVKFIG